MSVFKGIKTWDMHVLVVDDTSPDKTYEVVEQIAKKNPHVHLVVNPNKAGLGGAYLKGMAHAFGQLKADVVFEFDADLSHDATKIPAFLTKIDQGYDLVLGSRYIPGGGIPADWGLHRKFLSVVGNLVILLVLTDFRVRDWTGGYRAITKKVYQAVEPAMHAGRFTGYTFQLGFLHTALRKGFSVTEVPFVFVDRTIGVSKLGAESIKNTLLYILKVRYQEIVTNRIFKFAMVGGVGALTQLLTLTLLRSFMPYLVAYFLSIECAVVSNFILNNVWTFADRKLSSAQIPGKFIQFNLASSGSILIQQGLATAAEWALNVNQIWFQLPVIGLAIDTGLIVAVTGILLGMVINFFAYNMLIWKKK